MKKIELELDVGKMAVNILDLYLKADDEYNIGMEWYKQAHNFAKWLAEHPNNFARLNVMQISGIISAASANTRWGHNKRIAEGFVFLGHCAHFKITKEKCEKIARAKSPTEIDGILKGKKLMAFFHNIYDPQCSKFVTIDRHALCIALGLPFTLSKKISVTEKRHKMAAEAYKIAADTVGIKPLEMQATTWVAYIGINRAI